LIEGKVKMHTLLVFMSLLGGINYFGIEGVIFGPIIVALGLTLLELYKMEFSQELSESDEA
jgi:predicted PurR-regulated permease PerM